MRRKPIVWFEFHGDKLNVRSSRFVNEVRDTVKKGLETLEQKIQEYGLLEYDLSENVDHVVLLTIDSKQGITNDEHEKRFRPSYKLDTGEVNTRSDVVWEQAKLWLPESGVDYLFDQVDEHMNVYDFSLNQELVLLMAIEEKEHVEYWRQNNEQ